MAMFSPSDREEDKRAARQALYVIGGIAALLVLCIALVILYYNGYGY